ncbi:serine acetyltransferase [Pantoea sp.]|uniref:serine acetyltransferase n=1 Tax=Pantoea sp. TaxID=69393 RepID=UPI0028AA8B16|nr:serine acetyltransferase [Pantoea sp.]
MMNIFRSMKLTLSEIKMNPGIKSKLVVLLYRLASLHARRVSVFYPITLIFVIMHKFFNEFMFGIEISYRTKIGHGFVIWHAYSVVINSGCVIGKNFNIRQCCTVGGNRLSYPEHFIIGDNVSMGVNSCILGDDIEIGHNVVIGAGAIVMTSVADDHYVIAQKPFIKTRKYQPENIRVA